MATRVVLKGMYVFKGYDTIEAEEMNSIHRDILEMSQTYLERKVVTAVLHKYSGSLTSYIPLLNTENMLCIDVNIAKIMLL